MGGGYLKAVHARVGRPHCSNYSQTGENTCTPEQSAHYWRNVPLLPFAGAVGCYLGGNPRGGDQRCKTLKESKVLTGVELAQVLEELAGAKPDLAALRTDVETQVK